MTTGEVIAGKRRAAMMSQTELAARVGTTRVSISQWERNIRRPETTKLIGLANVFGCSLDEIARPAE